MPNTLSAAMGMFYSALSNMAAISHMWLLSTKNVALHVAFSAR